jgi:hypothetical protein
VSVQSSDLGPPAPSPESECGIPHLGPGETTLACGGGGEVPSSDDWTDPLVYVGILLRLSFSDS